LSKRNISVWGIGFSLFFFLSTLANLNAEDTTPPIITHIDEVLKENPLKTGEKIQMIKIAQDDTISLFVVRQAEGFVVRPHYHKTHAESIYVIKGTAQMLINDKWVDIKPGSIHFNPTGKVHSVKNTGNEPLVSISIFTPPLKEPDRHFVE
jgi:mannose-6-phosphate isomerase-like protein (cupin superfamily)